MVVLPALLIFGVMACCEGLGRTLSRDKEIFREILCVLKGSTPQECVHDRGIETLVERLQENDLDLNLESLENPTPKFLSSAAAAAAAAARDADNELPPGVASKREAFYSDWRRRR